MANEQINVVSPSGEVGTIPADQLQQAMQVGYSQATPEQIGGAQRELKYGTPGQQIATGLEGAAESATFGLSTGVERALGVKPEDIRGRAEENPVSHGVGEAAGLAGGMLLGTGEAAVVEQAGAKAGRTVQELLGSGILKSTAKDALKAQMFERSESSLLGRVGSQVAKSATEGALLQSGDEVARAMVNDPDQTVETALAHIGLSGLVGGALGGGLGSVSELWALRNHDKLTGAIEKIKDMVGDHAPAIATSLGAAILGHNPLAGYALGGIGKYVAKNMLGDLPHTLLKVVGSEMPSSGEAMQAALQLISNARKGEMLLNKAVGSVLNEEEYGHPAVDQKQIDKLKNRVDQMAESPEQQMSIGGSIAHYMPEHGTAAAYIGSRNMQYLASLRPNTTPLGPLDPKQTPNPMAESKYNQAVHIAEQPLSLLKSVKDGSLTLSQLNDLKTLYPALYSHMSSKLGEAMINVKSADKVIPYNTRLGMSMFMGQPLDSSMTGHAIQASQPGQLQAPGQQQQPAERTRKMEKISKVPGMAGTAEQARETKRATGH